MNSKPKSKRWRRTLTLVRDPANIRGATLAPRRSMHETKRSILKKLALRINQEDCFSS